MMVYTWIFCRLTFNFIKVNIFDPAKFLDIKLCFLPSNSSFFCAFFVNHQYCFISSFRYLMPYCLSLSFVLLLSFDIAPPQVLWIRVCPFVRPFVTSVFSPDNGSKDFFGFVYGFGAIWVGWSDRALFQGKNQIWPIMVVNGQK